MADTTKILKCPSCGEEMIKIYIEEAKVNVDLCLDGCGGILFDNRELEKFDETHENIDKITEIIRDQSFKQVDKSKIRICPVCNTPMVKTGANGDIEIDLCNVCGAKFLDHNELEIIRTNKNAPIDAKLEQKLNCLLNLTIEEVTLGKTLDKTSEKIRKRRNTFENIVHNIRNII